jgi:DNA polymerase-3 subunit beta
MKLTSLRDNLANGLAVAGRAVAKRNTLPVLGNVMLSADQEGIKFSATDLEIGINHVRPARIEKPGETTVPARLLIDFVNSLPSGSDVTLTMNGSKLGISCESYSANLRCIDAEEFPTVPTFDSIGIDNGHVILPCDVLKQTIGQVAFAASTDESRPTLTGVLVKLEGAQLTMAAADGFRLSVRHAALEGKVTEPISVIVPAHALTELGNIIKSEEADVAFGVNPSNSQAIFHLPHTDLVSQLIEGRFPHYEQIIPQQCDTQTIVNTGEFLKACRTASIFARNEANIARLSIDGDRMSVSASSSEMGNNTTEIDAEVSGEPIEISFNVKFLIDVLSVIGTDLAVLETTTPSSPGVIKPEGSEDFVYVVMPMYTRGQ